MFCVCICPNTHSQATNKKICPPTMYANIFYYYPMGVLVPFFVFSSFIKKTPPHFAWQFKKQFEIT